MFWMFWIFGCFWISGFFEFWSLSFFDVCSVFCCFVCCLFVVLGFWYTFVVSNVFLRVPKTESDFQGTEKAECTVNSR